MTVLRAGGATDIGLVRANNQDSLLSADSVSLFAVADGMGGHAAGEVASETAVNALKAAWAAAGGRGPEALVEAAREANREVWRTAQATPGLRGMGTTLVAVALTGEGDSEELAVVHVGDSRVYLLRGGELEQLTVDHSLVAELVAEGKLPADEAEFHPQRHVLTRALGVDAEVPVDLVTVTPFRGDRLLLCSDGLIREVSDAQVASILRRLADPSEAAKELVAEARLRGGNDNITVLIVDVVDDGDKAAKASAALAAEPGLVFPPDLGTDAGDTTALPAVPAAPNRLQRRREARLAASGGRPKARLVTVRVVGFFVLLVLILVAAAAGLGWYARSTYYVSVAGGQLTVYKGRPGGVLWFKPTVAERTGVTTTQVEARHLQELQAGVQESSLGAARSYVSNLTQEYAAAQGASSPTTSTTSTPATVPTTTTTPQASTTAPAPTTGPPASPAG